MFSLMLAVIVIIANEAYPFVPIQLTLISALTIGAPSVFLALEPNKNRITGNFLEKVLKKSLPGALTVVFNVVLIMIVGSYLALDHQQISTLAVISTGLIGLVILFRVSQPLDNKRWALFFTMTVSFLCCVLFLEDFFFLVPIQDFLPAMLIVLGITILDIYPLLRIFSWIVDQIERLLNRHQKEKRMAKATVLEK
jgi:cation-transporting ATPase E